MWLWGSADDEPTASPSPCPISGPGRTSGEVVFRQDMDCTVHASIENALDVPHTAFLHGGLFRKPGRGPRVEAVRTDLPDGVEVRYVGEPAAFGPLRLKGREFDHWDRFFLPSIAQVEYRVGDVVRIVNSILHLPLSATRTRAWFVLRFAARCRPRSSVRSCEPGAGDPAPGRRDARHQTANIRRFGGERYTSTDLDLLGNAIWRLLRQAERADGSASHDGDERDDDDDASPPSPASATLQL